MPLAGITFFDPCKKCYLSRQRQDFSGQNPVFVGRSHLGGGRRPLFTLRLEVPIKDRHYNPIRSLVARPADTRPDCPNDENDVDDKLACRENDDSVFFFQFWGKAGNIRGYRCYPGGRKELLVVQLVLQQQQHCWSTVRNSGFQSVQGVAQYQVQGVTQNPVQGVNPVPSTGNCPVPDTDQRGLPT